MWKGCIETTMYGCESGTVCRLGLGEHYGPPQHSKDTLLQPCDSIRRGKISEKYI